MPQTFSRVSPFALWPAVALFSPLILIPHTPTCPATTQASPAPPYPSTPTRVISNEYTTRMSIRRFTRRTNGFSKKLLNHAHSVALHFMYYNFIRAHASLDGLTPAQAAGVADRPYTMGWLVEKVERAQPKPNRPSFYKPRQKVAHDGLNHERNHAIYRPIPI